MLREFFLGFIRIHILYHASKNPIYGAEIMQELMTHGYGASPGTIYPILHSLEEEGYLKSRGINVSGRLRRYYEITKTGTGILEESKTRIKELVDEVLNEQ